MTPAERKLMLAMARGITLLLLAAESNYDEGTNPRKWLGDQARFIDNQVGAVIAQENDNEQAGTSGRGDNGDAPQGSVSARHD